MNSYETFVIIIIIIKHLPSDGLSKGSPIRYDHPDVCVCVLCVWGGGGTNEEMAWGLHKMNVPFQGT